MVVLYKFGAGGGGTLVQRTPIGDTDGVNKEFTTPTRFKQGTLHVYYNGQLFIEGVDYEVYENTFKLKYVAPYSSDVLSTTYCEE